MKNLTNEILTKAAKAVADKANELNKNERYEYKASADASIKGKTLSGYIEVELKEEIAICGLSHEESIIIVFADYGSALSVKDGSMSLLHLQWFIEAVAKEME